MTARFGYMLAVSVCSFVELSSLAWADDASRNSTEPELFLIRVNGRAGFMDATGTVRIAPKYQKAFPFSDGLAAVRFGDKWGFINPKGKWTVPAKFCSVAPFSDGMAAVRETSYSDQWKYIDKSGAVVIGTGFDSADRFHRGIARVGMEKKSTWLLSRIADIGIQCDYHYIDKSGRSVPKPAPSHRGNGDPDEWIPFEKDGLFGFVDAKNSVVIEPRFTHAGFFCDGLARVRSTDQYGFIDKTGRFVIAPEYEYANDFSEGLAGVSFGDRGWGFISRTGEVVIKPQFAWIDGGFKSGIAQVTVNRRTGYINKLGKWVWRPSE